MNFIIKSLIIPSTCLLLLNGCSTDSFLVSKEPVTTTYTLHPALVEEKTETGPARVVEIAKPTVPPGFDRDRIALYTQKGHRLDYFAASRWAAPLDELVQNFTRRTASAHLPFVVAVTPEQSIDADFRLQMKINEFQPVYSGDVNAAPQLKTEIEFTLIALPDEKIISSFTLHRETLSESNRLDVITQRLESMLQDVGQEAFHRMEPLVRRKK